MNSALVGTDPVVFFECQRIYDMGEMFHEGGVPEEYYEVPIGEPDIKRVGSDVTILSVGATLYRAMEAADRLQKEFGISAEIIDARSLVPFNYEKVVESVKKTGFIILTSDAVTRGSFLNDMATNISRLAFDYLDAPPVVVGARNWITPAFEYDHEYAPQAQWYIDTIHENFFPLPGYEPKTNMTNVELIRRSGLGV
jgi:2-oxoisovalerate dehydrogenase E1 component